MKKKNIKNESIIILDGSTGQNLIKMGMPTGVCPELWICENPEFITKLQREFVNAGSTAVTAPTFGANRHKLSSYGFAERTLELNVELVKISRLAVGEDIYIGGDISPLGLYMEPFGDATFDDIYNVYFEQAQILYESGVDFILCETMTDLAEARVAYLAAREASPLPVFVTMAVNKNGKTMSGNSAGTCLKLFQSMGVDAFGLNCQLNSDEMFAIIKEFSPHATIPLIAQPEESVPIPAKDFYDLGVRIFGGCCGSTPADISNLKNSAAKLYLAAGERELHNYDSITETYTLETLEDLQNILEEIPYITPPLCVKTSDSRLLEQLARRYTGQLLVDGDADLNPLYGAIFL